MRLTPVICVLLVLSVGSLVTAPAQARHPARSECPIRDASCTYATTGGSCVIADAVCNVPPGLYDCFEARQLIAVNSCAFYDAVGAQFVIGYTASDCTPVEFTGGSPRLQWDPLLNMFAINQCIFQMPMDVVAGPFRVPQS